MFSPRSSYVASGLARPFSSPPLPSSLLAPSPLLAPCQFANHLVKTKATAATKVMLVNGDHRVGLYATKDLAPETEIFFDYRYEQEMQNQNTVKIAVTTDWMKDAKMAGKIGTQAGITVKGTDDAGGGGGKKRKRKRAPAAAAKKGCIASSLLQQTAAVAAAPSPAAPPM